MYNTILRSVNDAKTILIIQAENPDGDSLGSSLALEEILGDLGKQVIMYCPVDMPKYLRYARGWDRVVNEWPKQRFDLAIIVDTASATLLERAIVPEQRAQLEKVDVFVLDHHMTVGTIPFPTIPLLDDKAVATGELVYIVAKDLSWKVNSRAAEQLVIAIMSDSLGLTTPNTTARSIYTVAELVEHGANVSQLENRRRDFMKKSPEILAYKGRLIERIEYHCNGQLATIHIPWEEIEEFSDQYNPSVLVLDEMRLVEGVRLAVAFKTYPDGKVTGKLRANHDAPVAETVAGFFGGGGHPYSSGFRAYDDFAAIKNEFIGGVDKALKEYDATINTKASC